MNGPKTVRLCLKGDVEECTIHEDEMEVESENIYSFNVVLPNTKYTCTNQPYIDCVFYIERDNSITIEERKSTRHLTWYPIRLYVWKSMILFDRIYFPYLFSVYTPLQLESMEPPPNTNIDLADIDMSSLEDLCSPEFLEYFDMENGSHEP